MQGVRSRGAVLLGRCGATQPEIARACGKSRALVGHWRNGLRVPTEEDQATLETKWRIPRSAWREPWVSETEGAQAAPSPPAAQPRTVPLSARQMARENADDAAKLKQTALADNSLGARERAAVIEAADRCAKFLRACETDEERLVESEAWRRLERALTEALRPFPKAALAAAEAIASMRAAAERASR